MLGEGPPRSVRHVVIAAAVLVAMVTTGCTPTQTIDRTPLRPFGEWSAKLRQRDPSGQPRGLSPESREIERNLGVE